MTYGGGTYGSEIYATAEAIGGFYVAAGETWTTDAGETTFGGPLRLDGTYQLNGTLATTATAAATGSGTGTGTGSANPILFRPMRRGDPFSVQGSGAVDD